MGIAHSLGRRSARPWTVLLVEESPKISAGIREILSAPRIGLTVICAASQREARAVLAREYVDAILVDFRLWSDSHAWRVDRGPSDACPVIALLGEVDVVSLHEAISTRSAGFYYKDQVDDSFGRHLLALLARQPARSSPLGVIG